jgi:hypothetical protein
MVEVLGDLIDASSVGGATFELGSAAFDMTRIVTGQLDAYGRSLQAAILKAVDAGFARVSG